MDHTPQCTTCNDMSATLAVGTATSLLLDQHGTVISTRTTYHCPTLCDPDCEALCHEAHLPRWKREHDVEQCHALTGRWRLRTCDVMWSAPDALPEPAPLPTDYDPFVSAAQLRDAWLATRGLLDRIAAWHSQGTVSGLCAECGSPWPCDTRRLIDYGEIEGGRQ